jgi:predicted RNA-binding Zn-ribbon protein involved in translation (DUF1610 family)
LASEQDKAKRHRRYRDGQAAANRKMRTMFRAGWFVPDYYDPNYGPHRERAERIGAYDGISFARYKKGAKAMLGSFESDRDEWFDSRPYKQAKSDISFREQVSEINMQLIECPMCGIRYSKAESLVPDTLRCPNCGADHAKSLMDFYADIDEMSSLIGIEMVEYDYDDFEIQTQILEDGTYYVDTETSGLNLPTQRPHARSLGHS